jgi:hypothetical protein
MGRDSTRNITMARCNVLQKHRLMRDSTYMRLTRPVNMQCLIATHKADLKAAAAQTGNNNSLTGA